MASAGRKSLPGAVQRRFLLSPESEDFPDEPPEEPPERPPEEEPPDGADTWE
jgi:hypothetical protein